MRIYTIKSTQLLMCLLLLLCFCCQVDKNTQSKSTTLTVSASVDTVRVVDSIKATSKKNKEPSPSFTLMERRSAGTAIS
jgi:hypothetical protein